MKYKVGDKVRIDKESPYFPGEIVTIFTDDGSNYLECENNKGNRRWVRNQYYTKIKDTSTTKFKVGDRVRITKMCGFFPKGQVRELALYQNELRATGEGGICNCNNLWELVEKEPLPKIQLDSVDLIYGDGVNIVASSHTEFIKPKKTIMHKLTATLKRVLSPAMQKQYKAGLINGDLELTGEGKVVIWSELQEAHEEALTKEAEDIIEEEKKNK